MKYLVVELTIALSVIASGRRLLKSRDGGRPSPLRRPEGPEYATPSAGPVDDEAGGSETPAGANATSIAPTFSLLRHGDIGFGDVVEVRDPRVLASHAFFGEVQTIESRGDDGPVELEVLAGPNRDEVLRVAASSATKYSEAYEINTRAACDYGSSLASSTGIFPCAVLAATGRDSYHVAARREGATIHLEVPLFRIRRLVEASPESDREFEKLMTASRTSGDDDDEGEGPGGPLSGVVELMPVEREGRRLRGGPVGREFGVPAVVTSLEVEGGPPVRYNLQHLFAGVHLRAIDPEFVRPYRVYAEGSRALCSFGTSWRAGEARACTVVSHSIREVGFVVYDVVYVNDEDKMVSGSLSFSKVHRIA